MTRKTKLLALFALALTLALGGCGGGSSNGIPIDDGGSVVVGSSGGGDTGTDDGPVVVDDSDTGDSGTDDGSVVVDDFDTDNSGTDDGPVVVDDSDIGDSGTDDGSVVVDDSDTDNSGTDDGPVVVDDSDTGNSGADEGSVVVDDSDTGDSGTDDGSVVVDDSDTGDTSTDDGPVVVDGSDTGDSGGNVPPTAPRDFLATPDPDGFGFVTLEWGASEDSDGSVVAYVVRRDGRGEITRTAGLTYVDEPPERDVSYRYTVQAVDNDGAVSDPASVSLTLQSSQCAGEVKIVGFNLVGPEDQVSPLFVSSVPGTVGLNRPNGSVDASVFADALDITVDASECTKSVNFVTAGGFQLGTSNNRPFSIGEALNGRTGDRWTNWLQRVEEGAIRVTAIPWPEYNTGGEFGLSASVVVPVIDPCRPDIGPVDTRYLSAKYADALTGPVASLMPESDDICSSTPYYDTVDPDDERRTLDDWLKLHGFVSPSAPVTTSAIDRGLLTEREVLNTEHANIYDLGFGRDVYCVNDPKILPCLIQNYRISDDKSPDFLTTKSTAPPEFLLSVAMERQSDATAFFAFDKHGRRIHSVDLDGNGFKSIPEACIGCHDGEWSDAGPGSRPLRGDYLPLDFATFRHFSRDPSYRYDPERAPFYSNITSSNRPINMLIKGLAAPGLLTDSHNIIAREIDEFGRVDSFLALQRTTPNLGTAGHQAGSDQSVFFARFCRSCHVSQQGATAMFPTEPNAEPGFNCRLCHTDPLGGEGIQNLAPLRNSLCNARSPKHVMPNARVTHEALIRAIEGKRPYSNSAFKFVVDRACDPFANPPEEGVVVTNADSRPVPAQPRP